jgi:uncharacterized membrane protein
MIGLGVLFRFYHYLDNRSLWLDEIYLATSIVKLDFLQLATLPLEYQQKAPIGILWLVRVCVVLFGPGEMSLRLVPFLGGLASLFVFLPVAKRFLSPLGVVLAMGVLALSPLLVYHSVEIKQYSTDLLATVLALYLYIRYHQNMGLPALVMWGVWGALLLWFSFPVIFVLAGIAIGLSLHYLIGRDWNLFFRSIIPFSMWLVSFGVNFYLFTSKYTEADWLISWFRARQGFMPLDASLLEGAKWVLQSLYRLLDYPLGVLWNAEIFNSIDTTVLRTLPKMALFLVLFLVIGISYFYKRDKKLLLVLLFPIALTLVASLIGKYPFYERLVVFLAPLPILLLAQGCARLTNFFAPGKRWRYVFPVILLAWPLWSTAKQAIDTDLFWDYKKSYYRDALLYIDRNFQQGDVVYIYWNIKPAYRFYKATYNLKVEGRELTDARFLVKNELEYVERLRGEYANTEGVKRIWFIYEPFLMLEIGDYDGTPSWYHHKGIKGGEIIKKDLSSLGKEVYRFRRSNVGVSLYEVSSKE